MSEKNSFFEREALIDFIIVNNPGIDRSQLEELSEEALILIRVQTEINWRKLLQN